MYVDKRLAGIQAVQTLSRLNRAHPGKDTTYVVDFVNEPDEILAAFKTYYETAELADDDRPAPRLRPARASSTPRATTTTTRSSAW
jgi:type I restriction enzyme R subunit